MDSVFDLFHNGIEILYYRGYQTQHKCTAIFPSQDFYLIKEENTSQQNASISSDEYICIDVDLTSEVQTIYQVFDIIPESAVVQTTHNLASWKFWH